MMINIFIGSRNILVCFTVLLIVTAVNAIGRDFKNTQSPIPLVNIALRKVSLKNVAMKISRQTGYRIVIEKEWAEIPISGTYRQVSLDNFFQRALKGKNISVISNDSDKVIIVRLFGNKKMDDMYAIFSQPDQGDDSDIVAVDPMDGQKLTEIRALNVMYEAEQERWKNDPNAVDPMDGQRLSEIKRLQVKNDAEQEHWKDDPDAIDPMDGQSVSEIRQLLVENDKVVEQRKKDSNALDPMDGQPVADIKKLQAMYEVEQERWRNDPSAVDPMDGQSMAEIQQLQAKYNNKNDNK